MKWLVLKSVKEIPEEWNALAGTNIFLQKNFLKHLEKVNPCQQSYNLLFLDDSLKAIYVDYRLRLNVFTYRGLNLTIPVRIMGIPCSVSKQGFSSFHGYEKFLIQHFKKKSGAKLILNCETDLPLNKGETLPTCKLDIRWNSFEQYLQSMRSHYRHRVKKALKKWQNVEVELTQPQSFDHQLYEFYENVFNNSQAQLEKLKFDFFQEMSLPSIIIKASVKDEKLGFVQIIKNGVELIFLFTGFNYDLNEKFDIYLNLLLEIIRYGIDNRFKVVDFGQTAEETKLKLGSKLYPKNMYVSLSNPLLDKIANKSINFLSYQVPRYDFRVFK